MTKLFANSGDPDQMPHSAASDLGLHCLSITILLVSRLHGNLIEFHQKWNQPINSQNFLGKFDSKFTISFLYSPKAGIDILFLFPPKET